MTRMTYVTHRETWNLHEDPYARRFLLAIRVSPDGTAQTQTVRRLDAQQHEERFCDACDDLPEFMAHATVSVTVWHGGANWDIDYLHAQCAQDRFSIPRQDMYWLLAGETPA